MMLKPCPFCGAALERREGGRYARCEIAYVHPDNGCVFLKWRLSKDSEFEAWNRRVEGGADG